MSHGMHLNRHKKNGMTCIWSAEITAASPLNILSPVVTHSPGMHLVAQVGQKKSGRTGDQIALHITCDALIMDTLRLHLFLYLKKKSGWTRDQITLPAVDRGCISSPHCQATVASALPSNSSHNNHLNRSGQWWSYFEFGHMNI